MTDKQLAHAFLAEQLGPNLNVTDTDVYRLAGKRVTQKRLEKIYAAIKDKAAKLRAPLVALLEKQGVQAETEETGTPDKE